MTTKASLLEDRRAVGYIRVSTLEQSMPDKPSLTQQRERIEGFGVNPQGGIGAQTEVIVLELQAAAARFVNRSQRAAGGMDDLVETVSCGRRHLAGPQRFHQLLAMQPVPPGQGQQLDQRAGLALSPRLIRDRPRRARDAEAAQQIDAPGGCFVHGSPPHNWARCAVLRVTSQTCSLSVSQWSGTLLQTPVARCK